MTGGGEDLDEVGVACGEGVWSFCELPSDDVVFASLPECIRHTAKPFK